MTPLISLTIAYIFGLAFSYLFQAPTWFLIVVIILIVCLVIATLLVKCGRQFYLLAILFILGWLNFQIHNLSPAGNDIARLIKPCLVEVTGWICEAPSIKGEKVSFILNVNNVDKKPATGRLLISLSARELEYGDTIKIAGLLTELETLSNPGVATFTDYLNNKGVYCQMKAGRDFTLLKKRGGNPLVRFSLSWANHLSQVAKKTLPEYYAALLNSIVFGSQAAQLASPVKEIYKQAGVAHLLVASGMQVSLLSNVGMFFIKSLALPLGPGIIIVSFINLIYALMVGWGSSVVRALIMSEIMLIAWLFERENEAYTALALSAFVILLIQPQALFEAGFQLSFAATWSLFFIAPAIQQKIKITWSKVPEFLATLISATLAPMLATTPVTLWHFNQVSLIGLATNFFILPWIDLLVILGFISTLLGLVYLPLAEILNNANLLLLFFADRLVSLMASSPWATLFLPTPGLPMLFGYYILLVGAMFWLKEKQWLKLNRFIVTISFLLVVALGTWQVALAYTANQLTVTMLDVGQGDAIFIHTITGKNILIDGGARGMGEKVLLPYFHRQGVSHLDLVVLTHPHDDHLGGLLDIFGRIKIKTVMDPGFDYNSQAYKRFRQLIAANKIKYTQARTGEKIIFDQETNGLLLAPTNQDENINNTSVVLRLTFRNFRMLFMGDEEKEGERQLLGHFSPGSLVADVLKIGHHGSSTGSSSDFLGAVKPKIALISCGQHNRFHHPHKSTLQRLITSGIRYLRTDQHGATTITSNGAGFRVSVVK